MRVSLARGKETRKEVRMSDSEGLGDPVSVDGAKLLIVDGKANSLDTANTEGVTPLFIAAQNGRAGTAKLLLEAGCDITMKTMEDFASPLIIAFNDIPKTKSTAPDFHDHGKILIILPGDLRGRPIF